MTRTVGIWVIAGIFAVSCIAEDDLTLDQRHRQLSEQLMCPVCDGQTIDQSSAAISEDMKSVIWQQLEDGQSNDQIRQYFVQRYGEAVLAAPTGDGLNIAAWITPAVVAAIGLAAVGTAYLRMKMPNATGDGTAFETNPANGTDPDLEPYLERVDAELETAVDQDTVR